jgi:hypothetical protein
MHFSISGSHEGRSTHQQNVQDDSDGPYITLMIVVFPNDFWSNVIDLSDIQLTLPTLREVDECSEKVVLTPKSIILRYFSYLSRNMMF